MKPYDSGSGSFPSRHFVSEWEDNVVFDADDPDFSVGGAVAANALMRSAAAAAVASNLTRSVTTYYGLNSASVVSNLNHLMKAFFALSLVSETCMPRDAWKRLHQPEVVLIRDWTPLSPANPAMDELFSRVLESGCEKEGKQTLPEAGTRWWKLLV
uniref:Uncharacterized protein n=1 Tax=Anopheles farauti TaxID=69004 RepID=A0A182Q7V5_9DIPT